MIYLFHNINQNPSNKWEITPKEFQNFVDNLKLKDILSLEIHFDDAREGIYTYAYPILKPFLSILKVTIFVVPEWINGFIPKHEQYSKFMSWEQLKILSDEGMEIASHSLNHPDLTTLSKKDLRFEVTKSRKILKKRLGLPRINKFSYPYGLYNKQVLDLVRKHYCFAYGLSPPNKKYDNYLPKNIYKDFTIPRIMISSHTLKGGASND